MSAPSASAASAAEATATDAAASTARRDALIAAESAVRDQWAEARAFEIDAPTDPAERAAKNKVFATFPYPYTNGSLHLGHAFSVTKAEFAVRFHRLLGKRALFPFGFHCTGMPILACALKLQKEIAAYGCPPVFPAPAAAAAAAAEDAEEADDAAAAPETDAAPEAAAAAPKDKRRKKKGKLAAKTGTSKFQWQIMEEMGVPAAEIPKFQDPQHWLGYWPPVAQRDLRGLGLAVDWRRTFITTETNPFYDRFIRWQFNHLRRKDKLSFGKLMSIITPSNKQVCSDHDRKDEGEGVGPQAYTLIKLRLQQPYPAAVASLLAAAGLAAEGDAAAAVVLPAATLRPETMYGQTNAFVLPEGEYVMYRTAKNEVFVCTDRSALNMAFQDAVFQPFEDAAAPAVGAFSWGECANRRMGVVPGAALLGCEIAAPLAAPGTKTYLLPLLSILMDKGTGIVTSVPSDAPADWAAIVDLQKKPELRAKFGIADHMVPADVVPVMRVPNPAFKTDAAADAPEAAETTDRVAVVLYKKYGIQSQNDAELLARAKDDAYLAGFERGVMATGPHAGKPVKDVKDLIKADMIAAGDAAPYAEPERLVISRTEEECVAGLIDQWFLKYGEEGWQREIREHVESEAFNPYNKAVRARLLFTIGWLHEWGCSRAFGLGTRLPFDQDGNPLAEGSVGPLIESLSDSTIYMAYYTIAALLQGGSYTEGHGAAALRPEQLTDAVFDYVFLAAPFPADCGVPQATLDRMRGEFEYWYPMDLRVSGKDLLNNHLVFSLYNHAAIWGPAQLPRGFYANGMLNINNKKMSKGAGNFITLAEALRLYGADATRFALASAGDSLEDANFVSATANQAILRLSKELAAAKDLAAAVAGAANTDVKLRAADAAAERTLWDRVLLASTAAIVADCKAAYEQMRLQDVARLACHEMCNARDAYKLACHEAGAGVRADVLAQWSEAFVVLMSPLCPFWAQSMWEVMKPAAAPALVVDAAWPALEAPDRALLRQAAYMAQFCSNLRGAAARQLTVKAKRVKAGEPAATLAGGVTVRVAVGYPAWQIRVIETLAAFAKAHPADAAPRSALEDAAKVNGAVKALFPIDPANAAASKRQLTAAMAFTAQVRAEFAEVGEQALELAMPFDELATVKEHLAYLVRGVEGGITAENTTVEAYQPPEEGPAVATPGKPSFLFA